MRKLLMVIVAVLVAVPASAAFAEDTKVTLGVRVWSNSWEEKIEFNGGGSQTFKMGSAVMAGPVLNLRFANNVFAGATYLVSTKDYTSSDWFNPGDTMDIKRKDTDITVGYMFVPQFGVFIGYKSLSADLAYTYAPLGFDKFDAGTWELKGPGIGILGNIPLTESFTIYGNFAIMFLNEEIQVTGAGTQKGDMTGASLEVGVAFAFSSRLSANIGYKAQSFSGEEETTKDTVTESFGGVTFGLNYTF